MLSDPDRYQERTPPPEVVEALPPPDPSAGAATTALPLPPAVRAAIATFDTTVDRWFDRMRGHPVADRTFYVASELGDFSLIWHVVNCARGLRSERAFTESVRLAAGLGAEAFLVNGLVKSAFQRRRPVYDGARPHRLRRPMTSSFPSGHASAAFFAAGMLSERSRWWPAWYAAAAVVAGSRIHVKIHHASDVAGGMVIGAVLAGIARRVWMNAE